jgi:transposase
MKNSTNERLEEMTSATLIVGMDIAKSKHWARFVDYRGLELGKAVSFTNDREGFEIIVARIEQLRNNKALRRHFTQIIIGMEPTGHYWKALAHYLIESGYRVVGVNPFHAKKAKELDDNSPTKNDKKDALTIARLVKDGRFFDPYLPTDIYAELRVLANNRESIMSRNNAIKNTITAILDEYFPEISKVFKYPLKGKAARQVLKVCPFPSMILELGEAGVLATIKEAVRKSVGLRKVRELMIVAEKSIGVKYGQLSTKLRLTMLIEELELIESQLAFIEAAMEKNASHNRLCQIPFKHKRNRGCDCGKVFGRSW